MQAAGQEVEAPFYGGRDFGPWSHPSGWTLDKLQSSSHHTTTTATTNESSVQFTDVRLIYSLYISWL